jgi:hypothetical protein
MNSDEFDRMARGGSWNFDVDWSTRLRRWRTAPSDKFTILGFRLSRSTSPLEQLAVLTSPDDATKER